MSRGITLLGTALLVTALSKLLWNFKVKTKALVLLQMPLHRGLVLALALISSSDARAEDQRQDSGLLDHLRLITLVEPSAQRQQWLTILHQGSAAGRLEIYDKVFDNIAYFWQQRQVPMMGGDYPLNADGFNQLTTRQKSYALEPKNTAYLAVMSHVRRMLWLDEHLDWPIIDPQGLLRLNDGHSSIPSIAHRLSLLGDFYGEHQGYVFNQALDAGVKAFQRRHGLKDDGVIGPKTLAWLNLLPIERARLLAVNFVAQSDYQRELNGSYLLVNIPAFDMVLVDKDQAVLHSRVIVGKSYRQTPVMSGAISNLVINPTWTVPRKLLRQDVLPHVRKDGHYLAEKQFDVFDYQGQQQWLTPKEWQALAHTHFPYKLVQRPGEHNSLGRYKFHFNNDKNIYLHDTPTPELFANADRALSSGCIRIEKIAELANWFAFNRVNDKRTWRKLQSNKHKTQWFSLSHTLPVHLVYWTAWVDEQHLAQYRNDIYHKGSQAQIDVVEN
ncbi:L,D-transpeptidase family protein [Shewanella sp.]|uniref:L,D-transpeptidase family protein n=1 Tax=Shewanella sp. TaxID=50422 RepID=UPI004054491F